MKKVVIFTMDSCPYCLNLKNNLNNLNIDFVEMDIHENKVFWGYIVKQVNDDVVPMVFLGKDDEDEGEIYVPGRDYNEESEIVEIVKKYMNI